MLRGVHGRLGVLEQHLGVVAVGRGDRQADAGREPELVTLDQPGRREAAGETSGDGQAVVVAGELRQQHGELVAAPAADGVAAARAGLQTAAHGLQQGVGGGVAERLVDRLEAVEIDQRHHAGSRGAPCLGERLAQTVAEHGAVGQPGHRVGDGEPFDQLLGAAGLGHVPEHGDAAGRVAGVVAQRADAALQPDLLTAVAERVRAVVVRGLAFERRPAERQQAGVRRRGEGVAQHALAGRAKDGGEALVALRHDELAVEHHDADRRLLEQHPQTLARRAQRLLGGDALGDVAHHQNVTAGVPRRTLGGHGDLEVAGAAVVVGNGHVEPALVDGVQVAKGGVGRAALGEQRRQRRTDHRTAARAEHLAGGAVGVEHAPVPVDHEHAVLQLAYHRVTGRRDDPRKDVEHLETPERYDDAEAARHEHGRRRVEVDEDCGHQVEHAGRIGEHGQGNGEHEGQALAGEHPHTAQERGEQQRGADGKTRVAVGRVHPEPGAVPHHEQCDPVDLREPHGRPDEREGRAQHDEDDGRERHEVEDDGRADHVSPEPTRVGQAEQEPARGHGRDADVGQPREERPGAQRRRGELADVGGAPYRRAQHHRREEQRAGHAAALPRQHRERRRYDRRDHGRDDEREQQARHDRDLQLLTHSTTVIGRKASWL